ncbi:MAG: Maf-like protein [Candidatus Binatia bacterium]|nr:MAG: Maf-like protein [Candidatus Binatia bacterium]
MSPPVVLASASPRRRELLASLGVAFLVEPANVEEIPAAHETVESYVRRLAADKAVAVSLRHAHSLVLGADTEVELDGTILGKPRDANHAVALLRQLSGRTHRVCTGVCVARRGEVLEAFAVQSLVTFQHLSDAEIRAYVASGEPLDKAGAYGAQGRGRDLIARIEGSLTNVIGLPLAEVAACLRRYGVLGDIRFPPVLER